MDFAIAGLFCLWAILSVVAQFRGTRVYQSVKYRDHFALLPSWSFFAPNPGVTDFQLLYRNRLLDGTLTDWRSISFEAPVWRRWLWYPEKRAKKYLHDWAAHMHSFTVKVKDERAYTHLGYILILSYVSRQPQAFDADRIQFMVARSDGRLWRKEPHITFISGLHELDEPVELSEQEPAAAP